MKIASDSAYRVDQVETRVNYADIGVSEYWQVDAAGTYLRLPLQAELRALRSGSKGEPDDRG